MVHHRINEKESNPNPHVNFISPLHLADSSEQESARQLLRSLAAQVRPIMKSHGFAVNSFEEYEHNNVFAGRNWNAGETIELVLRRPDGTFLPTFWLMSTLCHELAHIKHMNHGPDFQALWRRLRAEVRSLQDKGYYGDGYWSSGTRLADSAKVSGQGIGPGDLPEYLCGGAQTRSRPASIRTRRPRKPRNTTVTPSNSTGRQTAKRRKAGARVTSKTAFVGHGSTLMEGTSDTKGKGTGFGKQANSKRAREERALAIEQRMMALQAQTKASSSSGQTESESDDDELEDGVLETDQDRRETLLASDRKEDLEQLKSGCLWGSFEDDFDFNGTQKTTVPPADMCDPTGKRQINLKAEGKRKHEGLENDGVAAKRVNIAAPTGSTKKMDAMKPITGLTTHHDASGSSRIWACQVCTLENEPQHLACSACATPRGENSWILHQ